MHIKNKNTNKEKNIVKFSDPKQVDRRQLKLTYGQVQLYSKAIRISSVQLQLSPTKMNSGQMKQVRKPH